MLPCPTERLLRIPRHRRNPQSPLPEQTPKAEPATYGLPQTGTVAGGIEFEIERAKGDADELIDPEQLNLF